MPQVTYDRQCLIVNGKRLWIASGTLCPARVPRALWDDRLSALKHAGLNTVCVPIPWLLHEPVPGQFDFSGDLDLHAFLTRVHAHGLWAILRVGPCLGDGWDFGGLPPWVEAQAQGRIRGTHPGFLKACGGFFAALAAKVKDLQAGVSRKKPGPIILVQTEHEWFCGSDRLATGYLGDLDRHLRENGINVPIINSNNLYAAAEGQIDGWSGYSHLYANMRQLGVVRAGQPRIVLSLKAGCPDVWGAPRRNARGPFDLMWRMAEVLAAGAQFNLDPFFGGTNFGFTGGRLGHGPDQFVTASHDAGAPLQENGRAGASYLGVRLAATFATQLARVFTALEETQPTVVLSPESVRPPVTDDETGASAEPGGAERSGRAVSVCHRRGPQGSIIFVFDGGTSGTGAVTVLLPDGSTLPIHPGPAGIAWALLEVNLTPTARLEYCNLSAFGAVGSVFVCHGPAGAAGLLSINGAAFEVIVPDGWTPRIETHEGITVVVCNERAIEGVLVSERGVSIGAMGVDSAGEFIAHPKFSSVTRISPTGERTALRSRPLPTPKGKIALRGWASVTSEDYANGASPRYARIDRPVPLHEMGVSAGYGWMRAKFKSGSAGRAKVAFFGLADRAHLFLDGAPAGLIGYGPGAESGLPFALPLKKQSHTLALLVEHLGRNAESPGEREDRGVLGGLWEIAAIKPAAPKLVSDGPVIPLPTEADAPFFGLDADEGTDARRLTWTFEHRRKSPVLARLGGYAGPGLLLLNGEPILRLTRGGRGTVVLPAERLSKGKNVLQAAVMGDAAHAAAAFSRSLTLLAGVAEVSADAEWAFAKWEPPRFTSSAAEGSAVRATRGTPCWWRATFELANADQDLSFIPAGLSKGHMFVNGRNLSRYWWATGTGKRVPPQERYFIPRSWLASGANELVLFDEHGFAPGRAELTFTP